MANSSTVSSGDDALATQYNNLRKDVLDVTTGHDHTGAADHGVQLDHGEMAGLADDDHTQYQKESEKDAASGYAGLDASTRLGSIDRLPALTTGKYWKGVASVPAEADAPSDVVYAWLTVARLQTYSALATGTSQNPTVLIDNDIATFDVYDAINEYGEILFPSVQIITQFRYYGYVNHNNDGVWKIQYLNTSYTWTDWVTGMSTRAASWSGWNSTGGEVEALGIRWVCTTVDSQGHSRSYELEVKY